MEYNKFEHARIVGSRALQISQGAPLLIKLSEKDLERIGYNTLEIAKMEFKEGLIPITIKRRQSEDKKQEK
ncbi:DNA-directed RNA polymerase subunit K [Candidatus Woesearchaeota archaeon]|nr:DNA-directed RNA polymerase subunit K [Candidatus Woesearchaeota archaeon]|tara:strand:+ start:620 stop:832 length:213 start_codon:yes stop_codon:yes gene_type:complete